MKFVTMVLIVILVLAVSPQLAVVVVGLMMML